MRPSIVGALLTVLLAVPAAADAAYHYRATVSFAGTYTAQELDAGVAVTSVEAKARWRIADPDLVVTVQRGAFALFPSGNTTSRLSIAQHGFRAACDTAQQTFHDRLARRPTLSWLTLARAGGRGRVGFGWSGGRVDRRYDAAAEEYCAEPAATEPDGGTGDIAGAASLAQRFGVHLSFPVATLLAGRSIVLHVRVARTRRDVLDGGGIVEKLTGSYRVLLVRTR
jgi:hypothetical protein